MAAKGGVRAQFEHQLNEIQQNLLRMGGVVEQMLHKSMESYNRRDPVLAREVMDLDDVVDGYNLSIEMECLHLLALQNPMARDLRAVAAALKIITDVERMGDYCIDIARTADRMTDHPPLGRVPELDRMAELTNHMLRDTLQAFVSRDLDRVYATIQVDDDVDYLNKTIHNAMVERVRHEPNVAAQAIAVLMIARFLERIADHITNVGERVYYVETGEHKELH